MKIKFSIITPTYNRKELLKECIESVHNQRKGNFDYEHIIVDDGSIDGTKDFVAIEIKKDRKIRYFYQNHGGLLQAISRGTKEAKGEFIVVVDDDDFLPKNSLFLRSNYILQNPDIDWFYSKTRWVDDKKKPVKTWTQSQYFPDFHYERMLSMNFIQGGTYTIKKEVLNKIVWPKWLKKSSDYFMGLELLRPERKLKFGFLNKVVYLYRRHKNTQSQRSLKTEKERIKRYELDNEMRRKLHPKGLAFLAIELNKSLRELEKLRAENKLLKVYKKELLLDNKRKEELINKILNSKSWKALEKLRKIRNLFKPPR